MAVIMKDGNYMALPINIKRGNPIPLDASAVWYSLAEMENYAKTDATAYVGQILSLVNEKDKSATAYIVADAEGTLVKIGTGGMSAGVANEEVFTIENETLALRDWGKQYYRFVPEVPAVEEDSGNGIKAKEAVPAHYELQSVDEEHPWKSGLEPKTNTVEGKVVLAWYEPSLITVEGVSTAVAQVKKDVEDLTGTVNGVKDDVNDLKTKLADAASAFQFKGKVDSKDALPEDATPGNIYQVGDAEFVKTEDGWVELGSVTQASLDDYAKTTDLEPYAKTADLGAYATDEELKTVSDDVAALKAQIGDFKPAEEEAKIAVIEGKVGALETLLGEPKRPNPEPLKEGEEQVPAELPATGLFQRVEALEVIGAEKNIIEGIKIDGEEDVLNPADKIVTLPVFAGQTAGLVPVVNEEITDKAGYFLAADGAWHKPVQIEYNNKTYDSIKEYVEQAIADSEMDWESM